jgi:6,7-dimethyl-8-ribityllumazine synthase
MSLDTPQPLAINGADFSVGIVAARFNLKLVDALLQKSIGHLTACGVKESRIHVARVPGSNELPYAAQLVASKHTLDVVIALGVLIRGGTIHYELIAESATQGLQRVALDGRLPVINGVVVAETQQQAEERCLGAINRASEFAQAALEMAALKRTFTQ